MLFVGYDVGDVTDRFAACLQVGELASGLDAGQEEEGEPLVACEGPVAPWDVLWPTFRHLS